MSTEIRNQPDEPANRSARGQVSRNFGSRPSGDTSRPSSLVRSGDVRGLAADRSAVPPPDIMKVRGRLRGVWFGVAGSIAVGVYGDTPADTLGSHLFLSLFLLLAALSVRFQ